MNLHDNTGDRQCMTYFTNTLTKRPRQWTKVKVVCATHFCGGGVLNKITVMTDDNKYWTCKDKVHDANDEEKDSLQIIFM